ncbi:MAG TPA: type II toxin-antitoxin system antitoxin SocA domain-containing protein [Longimicrobium sp.]|nr:type II toxin-antitoxin system antitoxin SocA domain-containing protein [Longimicrobium sp.]
MVSAHDVAAYILSKQAPLSAMKLQKLVYYAQAWSTVWDDRPLFPERIEAWANGPVVRELYDLHRGQFDVRSWPKGDPAALDEEQRSTVDAVLGYYGWRNAQTLSDMTHMEDPWRLAREGLPEGVRGNHEITLASMSEYYSSLQADGGEAE